MAADFVCKRNDTSATFTATLLDSSGNAVNLTGGSVTIVIRALTATGPSTNSAATIVTPSTGAVSYTVTASDTAVSGRYMLEWHYTLSGGLKGTWPVDGWQELQVEEDLITPGGARLVGLGEVKDHLKIPMADRTHDARLGEMIDAAAPVVEGITGPVLQRLVQDETYDGGTWFISLRRRPVIEVHEVTEYRGPIPYRLSQVPTPDLGSIYSYMFQPPGRVVRRTAGGGITTFPPGADQVFVTYTAGFLKVPNNIREATLELIRINYQQTEQAGRPGLNAGDSGEAFPQGLNLYVPPRVRELLMLNRRHPSVA